MNGQLLLRRALAQVEIDQVLHFIQEDDPHGIGEELARWYSKLHSREEQNAPT